MQNEIVLQVIQECIHNPTILFCTAESTGIYIKFMAIFQIRCFNHTISEDKSIKIVLLGLPSACIEGHI